MEQRYVENAHSKSCNENVNLRATLNPGQKDIEKRKPRQTAPNRAIMLLFSNSVVSTLISSTFKLNSWKFYCLLCLLWHHRQTVLDIDGNYEKMKSQTCGKSFFSPESLLVLSTAKPCSKCCSKCWANAWANALVVLCGKTREYLAKL